MSNGPNKPETDRAYYFAHKARKAATGRAWALKNPERRAFINHRKRSVQRGIEFMFTLEAWIVWWGSDFKLRGRRYDSLQMCRYDDVGPYNLENTYKASKSENQEGPRPLPTPSW